MSSRPNESPRASATLSGLSLTTQLAAAATDSIPIAKLVLGVVSRIITLAEDIETSRDALHQLAESARTMVPSISAVVAGRKLNPEIEHRLEAIYEVLRAIKTLFTRHKAKSAFYKALSYAFTTKKRVESLSQELSRATQDLLCIAVVDTNAQVREDPRYIGEFRRIRLCDVDELKLIMDHELYLTGYSSRIYSGKLKGRVVLLRCFERSVSVRLDPDRLADMQESLRRTISEHDQVLEKLSTVPNLHRNIARLYGKNSGEHIDRFNVMKSACFRISEFWALSANIDLTWNIISTLVVSRSTTIPSVAQGSGQDAACWLEDRGLSWSPDAISIDSAGAPIIGLHNDLRLSSDVDYWSQIYLLVKGLEASRLESNIDSNEHHALAIRAVGTTGVRPFNTRRCLIPRRLIPSLDEKTRIYLQNALTRCEDLLVLWNVTGSVLRAAASGRALGSGVHTIYWAQAGGQDEIEMYRVEERGDELIHLEMDVIVPFDMKDEVRKQLGITLPGPASDSGIFVSNCDPAGPSSMSFRRIGP